jgi:hypothetical protein
VPDRAVGVGNAVPIVGTAGAGKAAGASEIVEADRAMVRVAVAIKWSRRVAVRYG